MKHWPMGNVLWQFAHLKCVSILFLNRQVAFGEMNTLPSIWRTEQNTVNNKSGNILRASVLNQLKSVPIMVEINFCRSCKKVLIKVHVSHTFLANMRQNRNQQRALPQTAWLQAITRCAEASHQFCLSPHKGSIIEFHTQDQIVARWTSVTAYPTKMG